MCLVTKWTTKNYEGWGLGNKSWRVQIKWNSVHVNGDSIAYINMFVVEHIPKENEKNIGCKIWNENITTNFFRIQTYDSQAYNTFALDLLILCSKATV